MADRTAWIALSLVPEIGPVTFRKLLSLYEEPASVFKSPLRELSSIEGVGARKAENIKAFSGWREAEAQLDTLSRCNARVVTFHDREYPSMLRQTEDAPALLYVKGSIEEDDAFAVAIVGSRKSTPYGRLVTERLAAGLSASGFTIVSGLARGIDTIAHINTILGGGRTIAVLGCGIDRAYPPENRGLMERIPGAGYVVSEFPCRTEPNRENFPQRNRLISGLSLGVVVVEAGTGSGALITAASALEQNREVFAVPGNITSFASEGTNALIKKGAKLVQGADDVVEELAPMIRGFVKTKKKLSVDITEEEKRVCDILTGEPVHIDVLSRGLSLAPSATLATLLSLEIKGIVKQAEGKRFYLVL